MKSTSEVVNCLLLAIVLGFLWSLVYISLGLPDYIGLPVAFLIGYHIPRRVISWLYK